ncbi:MAG TPA: hypothetical protein VFK97_01180 [Candidatus Saccharimonadales bacterium]|nr:hypothetical protein [Candidatus Saccharimonadales bacterium]
MDCIYCGGETKVTNSRRQKRNNQIWRRRQCLVCGALFTTHEAIELESVLALEVRGELKPFRPDLLLRDLMLALKGRQGAPEAAREVLATIVDKLLDLPQKPVFRPTDISRVASEVLKRFDWSAYLRYLAEHPSLDE